MPSIVHVVDDDASFRTAIARLLRASGYEVALYASAMQLLEMPPTAAPGCVLLDVRMPGVSGPELQRRLAELGSTLPIVFLTGHGDIPMSVRAIKAGAEDFLSKPVPRAILLDAIERALARHQAIQDLHDRLNTLRSLLATLTPREAEVFTLVVQGNRNKQIAHALGTTERTIKAHRQKVMQKLQARSLPALVTIAEQLGLLERSSGSSTP